MRRVRFLAQTKRRRERERERKRKGKEKRKGKFIRSSKQDGGKKVAKTTLKPYLVVLVYQLDQGHAEIKAIGRVHRVVRQLNIEVPVEVRPRCTVDEPRALKIIHGAIATGGRAKLVHLRNGVKDKVRNNCEVQVSRLRRHGGGGGQRKMTDWRSLAYVDIGRHIGEWIVGKLITHWSEENEARPKINQNALCTGTSLH